MMCEACTEGRHYACGLQTWCECDCDPSDPWSWMPEPDDDDIDLEGFEEDSSEPQEAKRADQG